MYVVCRILLCCTQNLRMRATRRYLMFFFGAKNAAPGSYYIRATRRAPRPAVLALAYLAESDQHLTKRHGFWAPCIENYVKQALHAIHANTKHIGQPLFAKSWNQRKRWRIEETHGPSKRFQGNQSRWRGASAEEQGRAFVKGQGTKAREARERVGKSVSRIQPHPKEKAPCRKARPRPREGSGRRSSVSAARLVRAALVRAEPAVVHLRAAALPASRIPRARRLLHPHLLVRAST